MTSLNYGQIVVVCAADNNYAMPLAVTMRSAIENLEDQHKIHFYIIDGGIQENNKQKILKSLVPDKCEVKFVTVPDFWLQEITKVHAYCEVENITANKYLSVAAYYRLFIPAILPETIEKAIYLDCDLVVRGNLAQLWQIEIGENYILAAQDMGIMQVSTTPYGLLNYQELGIAPEAKYFNSGVLVLNLKKWRNEQFIVKALTYFKSNSNYVRFHDQDVLNALLPGAWGELPPQWNFQPTIHISASWNENPLLAETYDKLSQNPNIIHYTSALKPWNSNRALFKEYFFTYVDLTAWSGWRFTIWRRLWLRLNRKVKKIISAYQ